MKYLTVVFLGIGVIANASSTSIIVTLPTKNQPKPQEDKSLYVYSKSDKGQTFLENINNKTADKEATIVVPHNTTNGSLTSVTLPTSQGIQTVHIKEETAPSSDKEIYMDYDKRWVQYNQWQYFKTDNEFDNKVFKIANLVSNDENAILSVGYSNQDKSYKKPIIAIILSGDIEDDSWHNFLCTDNCLNIDLNVDGKKYQKINMAYGGGKTLIAKNPSNFLNYIKNGETIKIRLRSVTGDYLIYEFEPETILDLKKLKSL